MKIYKSVMATVIAVTLLASVVGAYGIGMPYSSNRPLELFPGESIEISVNLQNMASDEAAVFKISLIGGEEVSAQLEQEEYSLAGRSETYFPLSIRMPSDAVIGSEYEVTIVLTREAENTEGVALIAGFEKTFKVVAVERPEKQAPLSNRAIALIVIAVLVLLWWILKKKR